VEFITLEIEHCPGITAHDIAPLVGIDTFIYNEYKRTDTDDEYDTDDESNKEETYIENSCTVI
jgi:hypothetical protein